ncbi:PEP-CTERM sorting domain-containing protein [Methylophilus aquaticus]|uniref:PEP-CTERM sorting domain-containing protein n=1 Tax=Methylophilus aquaticus TaxID=1971610 RepID=A0ABT9JUJ1_9PROT|nr:PEP-CTERM sorting domain-containing protein [Methylophilus aquaticus]MDP8568204.1 PEP-CTERM sorting domain-containing protein [Methylophilus aquaticus]
MMKKMSILMAMLLSAQANAALNAGDIMFTAFNADEDGLSFVTFVDIAANTAIYFSDNEWTGSAFNTGESYNQWISGSVLSAGSVVRLSSYDTASLSASIGTLSRVTVSGSSNWGISNSTETVYAYLGSSATAPTTFLTAITNGTFATDGSLTNTGLIAGVNAMQLTSKAGASSNPDYAEYNGVRSGLSNFADYKVQVANVNNWNVDTANNSNSAALIPNTTAFAVSTVPEPESLGMLLAGLGLLSVLRRKFR